jgi:dihydrofolate reductase
VPASVLYMSMSLDGYIAGPNDELGNPGGDGFSRLHEWGLTPDLEGFRTSGPAGELMAEVNATGAVLVGRRTAEQVDHWAEIITIAVSRSSCPVTGRPVPRSPTTPWCRT